MKKDRVPKMGDHVAWYPHAQHSAGPRLAHVYYSNQGALTLFFMIPDSSQVAWRMGVRHVDDPYNQAHPELAAEVGGWAWIPEPVNPPEPQQLSKPTSAQLQSASV